MHLDVPDLERITEPYAVGTEPPLIPSLLWQAKQGRGLMSRFKKSQVQSRSGCVRAGDILERLE